MPAVWECFIDKIYASRMGMFRKYIMEKLSYKMAVEIGCEFYFTGRLCSKGHLAQRRTANRTCLVCETIARTTSRHRHQTRYNDEKKQKRKKDPRRLREIELKSYYKRRDKILTANKNRYDTGGGREKAAQYRKRDRQTRPWHYTSKAVMRKKAIRLRTPSWLTVEDKHEITVFYSEACRLTKITGKQHHVDHIIPLHGKNISGLHVPWNLQVLEYDDNIRKSNKMEG